MLKKKDKLPKFTVRVSRRARNVWFRISPEKGLEVTVPRGFNQNRLPGLLIKELPWIHRHFKKVKEQKREIRAGKPDTLPHIINLAAIGELWTVVYRRSSSTSVRYHEGAGGRLTLSGAVTNKAACRDCLRRWLAIKARKHLVPKLRAISREIDLPFGQVVIRGQKTIWGSCTPKKNLNLNYKLLFIKRRLVRHIMIHELCHTRHLNHSKRFWKFVSRFEPEYQTANKDLAPAWRSLPAWVHQ